MNAPALVPRSSIATLEPLPRQTDGLYPASNNLLFFPSPAIRLAPNLVIEGDGMSRPASSVCAQPNTDVEAEACRGITRETIAGPRPRDFRRSSPSCQDRRPRGRTCCCAPSTTCATSWSAPCGSCWATRRTPRTSPRRSSSAAGAPRKVCPRSRTCGPGSFASVSTPPRTCSAAPGADASSRCWEPKSCRRSKKHSPTHDLEDRESLQQLRDALLHLRPEEKEVFLLAAERRTDLRADRRAVQPPVGTVKTQMHTHLQKLRKVFA